MKVFSVDPAASRTTALSEGFPFQYTIFTNSSLLGLHLLSLLLLFKPLSTGFCSHHFWEAINNYQPWLPNLSLLMAMFQSLSWPICTGEVIAYI